MPKKTEHEICVECGAESRICLYSTYYSIKIPHKQVKGSLLPTKGYCADCFLEIARNRLGKEHFRQLRLDLGLVGQKRRDDGSKKRRATRVKSGGHR